ncbi:signal peptidase I [Solirhodobacter olei]|uniref:signal peptidase I n=1 Tax=Solirhodobacter olei TaxID=2493082 RepID=UPI000FDCD86E|nr:signal peptidase I [Solirhodobacter olei]
MARKEKKEEGIVDTIKTVVYALLIAGVFRTLFFQPFWIPSGSMKDTLLVGDYIVINKMAYGYAAVSCPFSFCPIPGRIFGSTPKVGDVIVFRHPASNEDLIKRVIGVPGDTVQMKQGLLYINNKPVTVKPDGTFKETYAPQGPQGDLPRCDNGPVGIGGECDKQRYRETLPGGVTHDILNIQNDGPYDNTPLYTVPKGDLFVMGDNRDNSADSRVPVFSGGVGMVPIKNVLGRADMIIFSSAGRSLFYFWTWRAKRFFKWIE